MKGGYVRRLILSLLVLALMLGGLVLGGAQPASAASVTVKGTVRCANGHDVVGVWVQSSGGGSKWATIPVRSATTESYSATLSTVLPTNVQLHVGCGGSPNAWWSNNRTYNTRLFSATTYTRSATCNEAAGTGTRCSWIPPDPNPFPWGWCTWGAADYWGRGTGAHPNWRGNAKDWGVNARNAHWQWTSTPRARSILVIQPGGWPLTNAPEGHVAWVRSVNKNSAGAIVSLTITDMNGPNGFGKFATYDRPYTSAIASNGTRGMTFIYAP
jgi:surface antigen